MYSDCCIYIVLWRHVVHGTALWVFLFLTAGSNGIIDIFKSKLIIEGDYLKFTVISLVLTVSNVLISLILCVTVYADQRIYMARVVGILAANILTLVVAEALVGTREKINSAYFNSAFKWGIPLLFHTLSTVVMTQSDRILIKYIIGYSEVGIYAIAVTLLTIPSVIRESITNAGTPWIYEQYANNNYGKVKKLNNKYLILFMVITCSFILIVPELTKIISEQSYWDSMYCLIPLSLSVFAELMYSMPVSVEYYHKKTNYIMAGTILATVVNIILDIAFIAVFGIVGAAYATSLAKFVLFFFHCIFKNRIIHEPLFSGTVLILVLLGSISVSIFSILFINMWLLRYIVFVLIAIGLIIFMRKNRDFFSILLRR